MVTINDKVSILSVMLGSINSRKLRTEAFQDLQSPAIRSVDTKSRAFFADPWLLLLDLNFNGQQLTTTTYVADKLESTKTTGLKASAVMHSLSNLASLPCASQLTCTRSRRVKVSTTTTTTTTMTTTTTTTTTVRINSVKAARRRQRQQHTNARPVLYYFFTTATQCLLVRSNLDDDDDNDDDEYDNDDE